MRYASSVNIVVAAKTDPNQAIARAIRIGNKLSRLSALVAIARTCTQQCYGSKKGLAGGG
jgi:hypothetical protein